MKIHQNARHWAAKQAMTMPVVGTRMNDWLVDLHTRVFLDRAASNHAEERRGHLESFYEVVIDIYTTALEAGYPEEEAREITHILGNFDFSNHGWTEMMEFPLDEIDAHYDRYADFFEAHAITIDDPLGEFRPPEGIEEAPSTPEKLDDPDQPHAEAGFADDVYVESHDELS